MLSKALISLDSCKFLCDFNWCRDSFDSLSLLLACVPYPWWDVGAEVKGKALDGLSSTVTAVVLGAKVLFGENEAMSD